MGKLTVLLNILHVFFQDFAEHKIYIKIEAAEENVLIDYESIQVAFYHFFDNVSKYCLTNTEVMIKTRKTDSELKLSIEMISLEIKEFELKNIFIEGYSGENAKKMGLAGDGLGMYVLNRVLKLNNVKLDIMPHVYGKKIHHQKAYYCRNLFVFTFQLKA